MATEVADGVWRIDCRTRDHPNVYLVDDTGSHSTTDASDSAGNGSDSVGNGSDSAGNGSDSVGNGSDSAGNGSDSVGNGSDASGGERAACAGLTLVDAGWPGDENTIRDDVADAGFELADVARVLVTHTDADHVGALARLTPDLDAPVHVHEREAPYLTGASRRPWTARHGLEAIQRLYFARLTLPDLPVHSCRDDDAIGGFRVVHTPGHSPGHAAYVHDDRGVAFLGDLAWELRGSVHTAAWLTSYDASRVESSIRTLLDAIDDDTTLLPGHGPAISGGLDDLRAVVE